MRYGYWMPVFGGWLRNVPDEGMEASWAYVKRLTQRSEETGWDLTLIADGNTTLEHNIPQARIYEDVLDFYGATKVGYTPTLGVTYGGMGGEPYWAQESEVWKHPLLTRYVPADVLNPEFVRVYGDKAYVTYEPSSKSGPPPKPGSKEAEKDDNEEAIPGRIAIVDLKQGKVVKEIIGKPETEGVEFSRDGKKMVVTNESDNSITVHDMKSGKLLKSVL